MQHRMCDAGGRLDSCKRPSIRPSIRASVHPVVCEVFVRLRGKKPSDKQIYQHSLDRRQPKADRNKVKFSFLVKRNKSPSLELLFPFPQQAPPGFQKQSQEEDNGDRLKDMADLQSSLEV